MGPGLPAAKRKNVISLMNMVKALELAMTKAAALPEAAPDRPPERVSTLAVLGLKDDAGLPSVEASGRQGSHQLAGRHEPRKDFCHGKTNWPTED
jgi:hypothetical protein